MAAATASCELRWGGETPVSPPSTLHSFEYLGKALAVRSNTPGASQLLRAAFAPSHEPGTPSLKGGVTHVRSALIMRFEQQSTVYRICDFGGFGAAFYAVRDLFSRFCTSAAGGAAFYGASGQFEGNAFAILGESTVGKTVLMLHLATTGATFLGDETFSLDSETGVLRAFPRLPSLREPALRLLPSDAMRDAVRRSPFVHRLRAGRLWYALGQDHLLGIRPSSEPRILKTIFFLERSETVTVHPMSEEACFAACMQRLYRKPRALSEVARLRRALRDIRGCRVGLADPRSTACAVLEMLSKCA